MYKEIILHVGLHKTASTSIQRDCAAQRHWLAQHSLLYPQLIFDGRDLPNHSYAITAAISESSARYNAEWRGRVAANGVSTTEQVAQYCRQQLLALLVAAGSERLLLSAESVSAFTVEDMQLLQNLLLQHCSQLRVVAYVRNPFEAVGSMLQQRVVHGQKDDLSSLLGVVLERCQMLHQVFGEQLQLTDFADANSDPAGPSGHFLKQLGLPLGHLPALPKARANQRVSREAFALMAGVNRRLPLEEYSERRLDDLLPLRRLPGQSFRLPPRQLQECQGALLAELRGLADEFDLHFSPPPPVTDAETLWSQQTLCALESCIAQLASANLRAAAIEALVEEASLLPDSAIETAAVMRFLAKRLGDDGSEQGLMAMLQAVGADYFRDAALAVEDKPQRALPLMKLARLLRPQGELINAVIERLSGSSKDEN